MKQKKTTITFPDVSSFASNADSDTDDNQILAVFPRWMMTVAMKHNHL